MDCVFLNSKMFDCIKKVYLLAICFHCHKWVYFVIVVAADVVVIVVIVFVRDMHTFPTMMASLFCIRIVGSSWAILVQGILGSSWAMLV